MADHSKPTLTSNYSDFVSELDSRFDDLAVGLDPAATLTSAINVPTNSIRWNSASKKWEKFNGTQWLDLETIYAISISGNSATVTNGVYTNVSYANPAWITSLAGSKITGDISGNAGSATKLATARNINGVPFDGTAAISLNLNNSVTFNNSGTGIASGGTFNGNNAVTVSYNTVGAPSVTGANASGTWGINVTGNAGTVTNGVYNNGSTYNISVSGSAATLTTARTVSMTGDVIWSSAAFNGSADVTGVATLANSGVTAGTYTSPNLTIDAKGRITAASNVDNSRSWQSATVANNTNYTNTYGKEIVVAARCNANGAYGWTDYCYVNDQVIVVATWNSAVVGMTYIFEVPPGATYKVNFPTGVAGVMILR